MFGSRLPLHAALGGGGTAEMDGDVEPVSFVIVEDGTFRGNPLLVSSDGYSYCYNYTGKEYAVVWRCSGNRFVARGHKDYRLERCKVILSQVGDKFYAVPKEHNHRAKKGWLQHLTFQLNLKRGGLHDTIKPAKALLNDLAIRELVDVTLHTGMSSVKRSLAYFRHRNKKREGNSWAFQVDREYLSERTSPSFLRRDLWRERARHLIFATDEQLALLSVARTWYVSRNLKVSRLFYQLLTVHVFVHLDRATLVPALFVMMSGESEEDYAAVFKAVAEMASPSTEGLHFVINFDISCGIWDALRSSFPTASVRVHIFYWWRELKCALGKTEVQKAFLEGRTVHSILQRLFALPLLPPREIPVAFDNLCAHISLFPPLEPIEEYVRNLWMDDPESWCAFRKPVSNTNAPLEWHDSLTVLLKKRHYRFYILIPQLYREAQIISCSSKYASDKQVRKSLVTPATNFEGRLERVWSEYFGPVAKDDPKRKKWEKLSKEERISDKKLCRRKFFLRVSKLVCSSFAFCHF